MVATNLKAETLSLMDKRTAVEVDLNVIIERLCQPGGPGLSANLLDSEGFPRSDIDIPVVRADRYRLSELRNDHKELTEKINANIELLHSARLAPRSSSTKSSDDDAMSDTQSSSINTDVALSSSHNIVSRGTSNAMDLDVIANIPFAVVNEIADMSPTAEDGLQLGDQIVKFGSVEYQPGENLLQMLASEAQANQDRSVAVMAMRQGSPINLMMQLPDLIIGASTVFRHQLFGVEDD